MKQEEIKQVLGSDSVHLTTIQDDDNDESDGGKAPKLRRAALARSAVILDTMSSPAASRAADEEKEKESKAFGHAEAVLVHSIDKRTRRPWGRGAAP